MLLSYTQQCFAIYLNFSDNADNLDDILDGEVDVLEDSASNIAVLNDSLLDESETEYEEAEKRTESLLSFLTVNEKAPCRCGAHTLQLSVKDTTKEPEKAKLLKGIRKLAKLVRNKKCYRNAVNKANATLLPLPAATRWNGDFVICETLLRNKVFYEKLIENYMTPSEKESISYETKKSFWNFVKNYVDATEPVRDATVAIQKKDLLVPEFLMIYMRMKISLKKIEANSLAKDLLANVIKREKTLFENNVFLAAAYFDPRYQSLLSPEQKISAIESIKNLYIQMSQIIEPENQSTNEMSQDVTDFNDELAAITDELELELFLLSQSQQSNPNQSNMSKLDKFMDKVSKETHTYRDAKKYSENLNDVPIKYLQHLKRKDNELYMFVGSLWSAACTQADCERKFSELKFILSDLRSRLSTDLVEAIMLLRLNWDLFMAHQDMVRKTIKQFGE